MEKYRELYNLSKEILNQEQDRFNGIEEKASKYLTVLTLLVGASGFFGKWIISDLIPPRNKLEWALVGLGLMLVFSIIVSWFVVFNALRIRKIKTIPLDIQFFDDNELLNIFYALARGNKEALDENRKTTNRKSRMLDIGYYMMIVAMSFLIVFTSLFGFYSWSKPRNNESYERSLTMSEKEKSNSKPAEPSTPKPDPNIKPPSYDIVNRGKTPDSSSNKPDPNVKPPKYDTLEKSED